MDNTIQIIERYAGDNGLPALAALLGHKDTQRVARWIEDNHIPDGQIKGVRAILREEGLI